MKQCKKKILWVLASLFLAFLVTFVFLGIEMIEPIQIMNTNELNSIPCEEIVGEITDGKVVKQQFVCNQEELNSLAIRIATYSSIKDSKLFAELNDLTSNQKIQTWTSDTKSIGDNSFSLYTLDQKLTDVKGHVFEFILTSDALSGNAVTLWKNNAKCYEGNLSINQVEIEGQLVLGFNVLQSSSRINYIYLFIVSFLLSLFVCFLLQGKWVSSFTLFFKKVIILLGKQYKKVLLFVSIEVGLIVLVIGIEILITLKGWGGPTTAGYINEFRAAFIFICISTIVLFVFLRRDLEKKPENVFLGIAFIIGCLYVYCLPSEVFISWDEAIHYYRAVSLSRCITGKANIAEAWLYQNNGLRPENFREISSLIQNQQMLQSMYDTGVTTAIQADYLKHIWVICYIPSALALWFGRILHLPYVMIFYLGCFANLSLYMFLCYAAIKKVKSGKMIIVVVSLMTTAVFLAARYSYDTWVTGFYILGISYFIAAMQQKEVLSVHELIIMWGALFFGSFAKAIYFPIMGCLLLIPADRFMMKKQYIQFKILVLSSIGMLAASMVLSVIYLPFILIILYIVCYLIYQVAHKWSKKQCIIFGGIGTLIGICGMLVLAYMVIPGLLGPGDLRGGKVNASAQFLSILQHPIEYLKVLWNFLSKTYLNYGANDGWAYNLGSLAYLGLSKLKFIPTLLLILVSVTDKNQYDIWKRENSVRWIMIFLILITICMIATVLYISFTPYGAKEILGCQARYLIPLFLPFCALIGSSKIQNCMNRRLYHGIIISSSGVILLINLWDYMVSLYY